MVNKFLKKMIGITFVLGSQMSFKGIIGKYKKKKEDDYARKPFETSPDFTISKSGSFQMSNDLTEQLSTPMDQYRTSSKIMSLSVEIMELTLRFEVGKPTKQR